ncbi:MAG: acetyl-CoA C-acetyltransferase [Pseudorhodobacter sp.]|jgi:acetyl-CoA C-acetyltransferase
MPLGGAFARLYPHALAAPVIAACLADAGMAVDQVHELVLSNALGAGGNPARLAALAAGLPEHVAGLSIDRQCAGGLDAILIAKALVESGAAEVVLAGGAESYSRRPLRQHTDPDGGAPVPYDAPAFSPWPERDPNMHQAAADLTIRLGISRAVQDAYAVASHRKASLAVLPEITPLCGITRDGFTRLLTPAVAARARPITGSITPANAAIAADGAAFCLVVSEQIARHAPKALRIVRGATLGAAPQDPGLAPIAAMRRVLGTLHPSQLAQVEIMEAYAVQAIACAAALGFAPDQINQGGGALARGHPVGASGAILATRLFADMTTGYGMAAIAAAGGIGTALLLQA